MSEEWSVPAWAVVAALAVVLLLAGALVVAVRRGRRRAAHERDQARAEAEALRAQVAEIERRLDATPAPTVRPDDTDYVITRVGEPDGEGAAPVPAVPAPLFADLVLRESVVQAASLAAGLRRALAPEARHRIRFEMRREVKRARKQRRADLRTARREWEARQRAGLEDEDSAA